MKRNTEKIRMLVCDHMHDSYSESMVCKLAELPLIFVGEEDFSRTLEHFLNVRIGKINT